MLRARHSTPKRSAKNGVNTAEKSPINRHNRLHMRCSWKMSSFPHAKCARRIDLQIRVHFSRKNAGNSSNTFRRLPRHLGRVAARYKELVEKMSSFLA